MNVWKRVGDRFVRIFSSYLLCVVILVMLTLLTFLGTLEQADRGIYDVQEQYFNSMYLVSDVLGFPLLLPGAYLLLAILFVNLIVGGIVRMRKGTSTIGILVTHLGMALLLIGGLIEFYFSNEGYLDLPVEGQAKGHYTSYGDWELIVREDLGERRVRDHVIGAAELSDLGRDDARVFDHPNLPFQIRVSSYLRNSTLVPEGRAGRGFKGHVLQPVELAPQTGQNMPGLAVNLVGKSANPQRLLLQAKEHPAEVVTANGKRYLVGLQRESYELPFKIELEEFVFEKHPKTGMAKEYSSYVYRIEGETREKVHITMNQPLRHQGYILYQASYETVSGNDGRIVKYYPVLTVSRNPADSIPWFAVVITTLGLLIHFIVKLSRHISSETRRRTA